MQNKQSVTKEFNPSTLTHVYSFGEIFRNEWNSLFADEHRALWITDGSENGVIRNGEFIELKDALREDFQKISLKEALEWYARCAPFSTEGTGTVDLLCEMAAKKLSSK